MAGPTKIWAWPLGIDNDKTYLAFYGFLLACQFPFLSFVSG